MLKLCRAYGLLTYETPALTDCLPMRCVRSPTAYLRVAGALRHCKSSAHRLLTAETPALCGGAWPPFTDCLPMRRLRFLHGIGAVSATSLSACKVSQGLTLHCTPARQRIVSSTFVQCGALDWVRAAVLARNRVALNLCSCLERVGPCCRERNIFLH